MIRELKKEIMTQLRDLGHPVAFTSIPDSSLYPHVVIDLPNDAYQEGLHNLALDVDVWDKATSTQAIDTIAEGIISRLNRKCIMTQHFHVVIYLLSMGSIESDDPTLRRKTLIFNLQLRSKENGTM